MKPTISILVSTYNRKELVKNAIDSILAQTYTDFELIIIDDTSTDGTREEILACYPDNRLTYIYNNANQAAASGDRIHIQRFVHELARGKYWIYLDSDDHWLIKDLLERQIALFNAYPSAAMVTGGQESFFVPEQKTVFNKGVFPSEMSSDEFLDHFATYPIESNIIGGARLYNKELFIKSGALTGYGGRWESGYELTLAPACYGDHIYIDEPCIHTEIRPENASFCETQLRHYLDSVDSTMLAFKKAMKDFPERKLEQYRNRVIRKLGETYLGNADHIKLRGSLSYCSAAHIARYVTLDDVQKVEEMLNA